MNKNPGFQEILPDLMNEWNFEKNEGINSQELSAYSKKQIWWKCSHGHEWRASVASRVKGIGCPYCSRKLRMKYNNLSATPANLCSEWKPKGCSSSEPTIHPIGSTKKVWWKKADSCVIWKPSDSSMRNPFDEVQSNA